MKLRRTGTVDEYQQQFLPLLARCRNVTEQQQIDIFTTGLRNPLQTDVELQSPETLDDAMALARAFEHRLELEDDDDQSASRVPPRSVSSHHVAAPVVSVTPRPSILVGRASIPTPPAPVKGAQSAGTRFKHLTPQEMAQRRADGLCFNRPEKFSREHIKHCSMKGLYLMELDDSTPVEDDEAAEDEVEISLHALTGIKTGETMRLSVSIVSTQLRALVDSGSTHSFISSATASRLGLTLEPRSGLTVGVANGDRVPSPGVCKQVSVTIDNEQFFIDLYVLPLEDYELVLGCQWLKTLGPILWDFEQHTMSFWRHDHPVKWRSTLR